jgi:hypothetical protein
MHFIKHTYTNHIFAMFDLFWNSSYLIGNSHYKILILTCLVHHYFTLRHCTFFFLHSAVQTPYVLCRICFSAHGRCTPLLSLQSGTFLLNFTHPLSQLHERSRHIANGRFSAFLEGRRTGKVDGEGRIFERQSLAPAKLLRPPFCSSFLHATLLFGWPSQEQWVGWDVRHPK